LINKKIFNIKLGLSSRIHYIREHFLNAKIIYITGHIEYLISLIYCIFIFYPSVYPFRSFFFMNLSIGNMGDLKALVTGVTETIKKTQFPYQLQNR
jgi:hypothetical protein